jgi:hypothetical protein
MDKNNALIAEIYEKYGEWLEYDVTGELMLQILTTIAVKERDRADQYKMALKRCELMHK